MVHEIGGASNSSVRMQAHDLHSGKFTMPEVSEIKCGISPVGKEPVVHEAVVLIAAQVCRAVVNVVGREGRNVRGTHLCGPKRKGGLKGLLNICSHLSGDGGVTCSSGTERFVLL